MNTSSTIFPALPRTHCFTGVVFGWTMAERPWSVFLCVQSIPNAASGLMIQSMHCKCHRCCSWFLKVWWFASWSRHTAVDMELHCSICFKPSCDLTHFYIVMQHATIFSLSTISDNRFYRPYALTDSGLFTIWRNGCCPLRKKLSPLFLFSKQNWESFHKCSPIVCQGGYW